MVKNTKISIDSIFYISAVYSYQTLTDYIKEYQMKLTDHETRLMIDALNSVIYQSPNDQQAQTRVIRKLKAHAVKLWEDA